MDSPQSVVSPFRSCSVFTETEKQNTDLSVKNSGILPKEVSFQGKTDASWNKNDFLGVLEVYVHQARDIHNICIYHKQDVYAKICLTSDPEYSVSTNTINGGGQNPVFNEKLRINVRTIESSLKCEIWMLSRVKNYLQDQLLGFALVPLSEVLAGIGKLDKEFSMSSTDLFHSPAGYVRLSISYAGVSPEVIAIPATVKDVEIPDSLPCELDKIEFPDPKIVNENHLMVSEYFGVACTNLDSEITSDTDNELNSELGVRLVESFSNRTDASTEFPKQDSPPSSVSTNGSPPASLPVCSQSSETPLSSKSPNKEYASLPKDTREQKITDSEDAESKAPDAFPKPVIKINIEPEQKMVQQDIVDMYMKSMQQFTESLAKMKLPLDTESGTTSPGNSSSDQKTPGSKNSGSRVFYGSSAFF